MEIMGLIYELISQDARARASAGIYFFRKEGD